VPGAGARIAQALPAMPAMLSGEGYSLATLRDVL